MSNTDLYQTLIVNPQIHMIARICHENNKALCEAIGDNSQPSWEDAPEWQKKSAIAGVKFHLENPDSKPEDSHNSWMKQKEEDGWVYGKVKHPEKKTHPCMVPYAMLSESDRIKDHIFLQTVRSLEKKIVIDLETYSRLLSSEERLTMLECCGVDNWEWYGESLNPEDGEMPHWVFDDLIKNIPVDPEDWSPSE